MKPALPALLALAASCCFVFCMARAQPKPNEKVDEIDLEAMDDTAEDAAARPHVSSGATADGYIDVSCDDATISSILKQFRRAANLNVVSGDSTNLSRRVSARLTHVKWYDALESILQQAGFRLEQRSGTWFVMEKTEAEVQNATRHYALKHASAQDLADLFNGVTLDTSYLERNSLRNEKDGENKNDDAKKANANDDRRSALAGRARATAFPNVNVLILTGTEANLDACEKIINELDRPVTQVYIEARFIELSNAAMHNLGVKWNQLESWGASVKNVKAGWEHNNGKAADYGTRLSQGTENKSSTKSTSTSSSTSDDATSKSENANDNETATENANYQGIVPTSIGEAAGAGASAASMGWKSASTFAGQISADEFALAISAFESLEDWKMFSNPRIIVSNGKEAKVDMTKKEPNVEVTSDRSGTEGQYLSVSTRLETIPGKDRNLFAGEAFFSYGISLSVKPRVSPTGLISVEVVPSISEKSEDKEIRGASSDSVYTTYPIINMKSISTEFTMKDGATAVIGGLTRTEETDVDSGIPYLREMPWIGPKLFGWKSRQKVQTEILVCVTVGIANPESLRRDAGLPLNAVLGREYVEGRRFEPGERPDAVRNIQKIDVRSIEEIRIDPYRVDNDKIDLED